MEEHAQPGTEILSGGDNPKNRTLSQEREQKIDVHPLEIFPTEIWERIFEPLCKDPRQVINISETHDFFQKLFQDEVAACRLEEVIPLVLSYLGKEGILNCRSLCKRVTDRVDMILDNVQRVTCDQNLGLLGSQYMPPKLPASFEWNRFKRLRQRGLGMKIMSMQKLKWIQSFFKDSENDHPGKTLNIIGKTFHMWTVDNYMDNRIFLEKLVDFLPCIGNQIRYLNLCCFPIAFNIFEQYYAYRNILTQLPNLYHICGSFSVDAFQHSEMQWSLMCADLQANIKAYPLPQMRYLEQWICRYCTLPLPFIQEISRAYGKQLSYIEMDVTNQGSRLYDDRVTFPALKRLKSINGFRHWIPLEAPQVVEFDVELFAALRMSPPEASPIYRLVECLAFFPSLSKLNLKSDSLLYGLTTDQILGEARFESVKTLKIVTKSCQLPLSFFTALFPKLETFEFIFKNKLNKVIQKKECGEFEADVKLLCSGQGYRLNIWSLASLNAFKIWAEGLPGRKKHCSYTRQGLVQFLENSEQQDS